MDPGLLLRAVRRSRRLSQRELAEAAGVPHSTIDRIESGRGARPAYRTIEAILEAAGYQLIVFSNVGRPLVLDDDQERLHDLAGRHLPAHLESYRLTLLSNWYGWARDGNYPTLPRGRVWAYHGRVRGQLSRFQSWYGEHRWDDAT